MTAPRPSFANSHSRSAFGFQAMTPDTYHHQDITMSDRMDVAQKLDNNEVNGRKSFAIYLSFNCIYSLPDSEPTIQDGNKGSSLSNIIY